MAQPLEGPAADDDALMARLADAELVLLGEPSHGTQEAYEERARITERLIEEAGFSGLVIEGEWPAARRVDLYVRGLGSDVTAVDALGGFADFPDWMWRNRPFAELVEWLRERNAALPYEQQAGVYGLDLFSLPESVAAVPAELEPFDRAAATRVERLYECAGASGTLELEQDGRSCVASVQAAFERATAVAEDVGTKDAEAADEAFSAVQNARIVVNGRRYAIGEGGVTEPSWNVRDRHMVDTVAALRDHLRATGRSGRLLVWAHNSHVGDARVTSFADLRQVNLGQLVRERWPRESAIVGFSTYTGTVTAAQAWGLPGMTMEVLPALADSHHELLHRVAQSGVGDFYVVLGERAPAPLLEERIERFIGVLYLPLTERHSHYFTTRLSEEYDFVIHLDQTTALELLDEAVP